MRVSGEGNTVGIVVEYRFLLAAVLCAPHAVVRAVGSLHPAMLTVENRFRRVGSVLGHVPVKPDRRTWVCMVEVGEDELVAFDFPDHDLRPLLAEKLLPVLLVVAVERERWRQLAVALHVHGGEPLLVVEALFDIVVAIVHKVDDRRAVRQFISG